MNPPEPPQAGDSRRELHRNRIAKVAKGALLVAGFVVLALLIREAGPEEVARTLIGAAAWMPLVIACDLSFFACEAMGHRAVLGEARHAIPWSRFVRASFLYYCVLAIAPLGRAGAEVARGASFAPYVGAGRATAAAANMQGGVLLANLAISIPCWIAVSLTVGPEHPLAWLLVLNGLGTGAIGIVTLLVVRRSRVGRWLGERFPRLSAMGADLDAALVAPRRDVIIATSWCVGARVVQIGMYAAILAAISASVTVLGTLVALGVHLVGAGFGDFVPNQVGILEGAYRIFAPALGLEHDPARAMSIALVARIGQFMIAGTGLATLSLLGQPAPAGVQAKGT